MSADSVSPQAIETAREKLDLHVREIVQWHFSPETGSPFWLDWAKKAGWDPRAEVRSFADIIARFCGSFTFVWVHLIWFGAWVIVNDLPGVPHFDPFPFTFLTLVVSLEAIFLSAFILTSQNHETRLSERRNQLDLQINLLTEQENTKMIAILQAIKAAGALEADLEVI